MKTLHIQPRQTGKTTQAITKFLENPAHTLLVATNLQSVEIIRKSIGIDYAKVFSKNIISQTQLSRSLENINRTSRIIFDEYLSHNYSVDVYHKINSMRYDVLMYATPIEFYDKVLFNIVKNFKSLKLKLQYTDLLKLVGNEFENDVHKLYYNIVTDFDTKIILHSIQEFGFIAENNMNELKNILGQKEFERNYLNKFLN